MREGGRARLNPRSLTRTFTIQAPVIARPTTSLQCYASSPRTPPRPLRTHLGNRCCLYIENPLPILGSSCCNSTRRRRPPIPERRTLMISHATTDSLRLKRSDLAPGTWGEPVSPIRMQFWMGSRPCLRGRTPGDNMRICNVTY